MSQCLICGSNGEDLIFKFYCSNPHCQNFHKSMKSKDTNIVNDITEILKDLWVRYEEGETEEEFLIKFFANGGRFSLVPDQYGKKDIKISKPKWLVEREINH